MDIIEEQIYKTKKLDKYNNYFKFINSITSSYDAIDILPMHIKNNFTVDLDMLKKTCKNLDSESNFISLINKTNSFLDSLSRSKVNLITYKAFLEVEQNESVKNTIRSFKPVRGYSNKVCYNTLSNVTGRLTVKRGPNILTLPKKYRSILETRFNQGSIISIDFSSLEPRLCLKLSGKDANQDLYQEINNILDLNLNRSVIKRAIISVLYGAHYTSLKDISEIKSKALFDCIKDYFCLDEILTISKNIDKHGIRRNYEGRPLWNLEEDKENILINNYIQSSAVDIALKYFSSLPQILDLEKAVPLFVLHDAMIFDIHNDYLQEFKQIISQGYKHDKLGNFPLKMEIFNNKNQGLENEY